MKKLIIPIILVVVIGFIAYVAINKDKEEKKVKNYVNDNYQELTTIANAYLNEENVTKPTDVIEVNVYKGEYTDTVEFSMNDKYGFYYSTEDLPTTHKNIKTDLIELGGNKYRWDELGNKGTTIKIRKNWYYFKVTK